MYKLMIGFLCVFSLQSCATILSSNQTNLHVDSDPAGARVFINGAPVGKTPLDLQTDKRKDLFVEARLDGYDNSTRVVPASVGAGWVIADVVLSGVLGVVIDAVTGSWNSLDNHLVMFVLDEKGR